MNSETATTEALPTPLTPEQGTARSAFIDFCWNVQLATARRHDDPALRESDAKIIFDLLSRSAEEVRAQGETLWNTWIASGGHERHPAIFTKENMLSLLLRLNTECVRTAELQRHRASIADKLSATVGE